MKDKEKLIGEPYRNKDGLLCRMVNGKEIIQVEEETERDRQFNLNVNLWRMRNL